LNGSSSIIPDSLQGQGLGGRAVRRSAESCLLVGTSPCGDAGGHFPSFRPPGWRPLRIWAFICILLQADLPPTSAPPSPLREGGLFSLSRPPGLHVLNASIFRTVDELLSGISAYKSCSYICRRAHRNGVKRGLVRRARKISLRFMGIIRCYSVGVCKHPLGEERIIEAVIRNPIWLTLP
jgi:hypothetical protein